MVMSEPSTNYLTTILVRNLGRNWRWQTSKSALTGQQQEHPCWVAFAGFSGGTYLYLPISTCQQSNSLLRKVLGFSTSLEWRYGKFIGQDHPTVKEQDWDAPPPPLMSFSSFLIFQLFESITIPWCFRDLWFSGAQNTCQQSRVARQVLSAGSRLQGCLVSDCPDGQTSFLRLPECVGDQS